MTGIGDTAWRSNLLVYNPRDAAQNVRIELESGAAATITLAPRELRLVPDAVRELFGIERGGTLTLIPDDSVIASVRTFVQSANGTAGFVTPAFDAQNFASARFPAIFAGAIPGDGFRTNLFVTDAFGTTQTNGLGRGSGHREVTIQPERGSAIASVVAIDNLTHDATHYLPDTTSHAQLVKKIPLLASIDHPDGTKTRSDLYLHNPTATPQYAGMALVRYENGDVLRKGVLLAPRETRVVRDPLVTLFGVTGRALLDFGTGPYDNVMNGLLPTVRVASRTYTTTPGGGTYGTSIPPLSVLQLATQGESLELFTETGPDLRVSLVVFNTDWLAYYEATVRVEIFGPGGGDPLTAFGVKLVSQRSDHTIDDLFLALPFTPPPAARIVVTLSEGLPLISAYVLLTDRRSGDVSYVAPQYGGMRAAVRP